MAFKKKLAIILAFLSGIFLFLVVLFFFFLYKPSFFVSLIFGEETVKLKLDKNETEENKKLTEDEIYELKNVVSKNLVHIKEGVALHPGVVIKVGENGNTTDAYLLSINELEWPFIKATIQGGIVLKNPKQVYKCKGFYLINFDITGMWVPEVQAGSFIEKGVIVPGIEAGEPIISEFYGNCSKISGLIFNEFGDFAGICTGSTYTPADTIANIDVKTCRTIFKEKRTENLKNSSENSTTEEATPTKQNQE